MTGICVTPTDEYGNRDYSTDSSWGRNSGPTNLKGCSFNTDCEIGSKCMKEAGQIEGLCMK